MQTKHNNEMGQVFTTLTIINSADQTRAEDGTITPDKIRTVTLERVLVDSGATTLCLPANVISSLGLRLLKQVDVATAMGIKKARIFENAKISVCGREGTFECLELPNDSDPLLGVIPLEALGLELDLQNHVLKVLPISPTKTYLTI